MNNPRRRFTSRHILGSFLILFFMSVQAKSCIELSPTIKQPLPTSSPALIVHPSSTPTPRFSASTHHPSAARHLTSTALALWTAEEQTALAPTLTFTPTAVPEGIYTLLFYPPLVMDYPPSQWKDNSDYLKSDYISNYLTAKSLESCVLSWRGGSGVPEVSEPIQTRVLGKIKFQVLVYDNTAEASKYAWYLEQSSVAGFDYSQANPTLVISAFDHEWDRCVELGEKVFATLRIP
jgi:hypothetical protein